MTQGRQRECLDTIEPESPVVLNRHTDPFNAVVLGALPTPLPA